MKKLLLSALVIFVPLSVMANGTNIGHGLACDSKIDQVYASGNLEVSDEDLLTFDLIKYSSIAKVAVLKRLYSNHIHLKRIYQAVSADSLKGSSAISSIETAYPRDLFPELYVEWDQQELFAEEFYDSEFGGRLVDDIAKQSLEMTILDLQSNYFADKGHLPNEEGGSYDIIKSTISKRKERQSKASYPFIFLPTYKNISFKRLTEFYLFNERPEYFNYHFFTEKLFPSLAQEFAVKFKKGGKTVIRSGKWRAAAPYTAPEGKMSSLMNMPSWDPYDRSDVLYKKLIDETPQLIETLRSYELSKYTHNLRRPLAEAIENEIVNSMKAINSLLNTKPLFRTLKGNRRDLSKVSAMHGHNKKFLSEMSFVFRLNNLGSIVSEKCPNETFNLFQNNLFHKKLENISYASELDRSESSLAPYLYGVGMISLLTPYGPVIAPAMFGLGFGESMLVKTIPNYLWAQRSYAMDVSLHPLFNNINSQNNLVTKYQEILDMGSIKQNFNRDLGLAIGLEMPLVFAPSILKLAKGIRSLETLGVSKSKLAYNLKLKKWYRQVTGQNTKNITKLQIFSNISKNIIKDTNVQVGVGYFSVLMGLQVLSDHLSEDSVNLPSMPSAESSLLTELAEDFESEYPKFIEEYFGKIRKELSSYDRKNGLSLTLPISSGDVLLKLHDGQNVIKIFDTLYIPLEFAKKMYLPNSEIVESYLIQSVVESDTLKALAQDRFLELVKVMLEGDRADDYKVKVINNQLQVILNEQIMVSGALKHNLQEIKKEAKRISNFYKENDNE